MANSVTIESTKENAKYISGTWNHLFADDKCERSTRILLDASTQKLLRLDVQHNLAISDSYRQAFPDELADVEDSLLNANGDLFDTPNDYGLELIYTLPEWVTGG